jgi:hypothetical protein
MHSYFKKMKDDYKNIITVHGIEQSLLEGQYTSELLNMKDVYSLPLMKPHTNGLLERSLEEIEKINCEKTFTDLDTVTLESLLTITKSICMNCISFIYNKNKEAKYTKDLLPR